MSDPVAVLSLKLSHKSKQNILRSLYDSSKPLRQYQIAEKIGKDKSTVAHHLSELEKLGVTTKINVDGIIAYKLSTIGKRLVEAVDLGYLNEGEEIILHAMELASIAGMDIHSEAYEELKKTIEKWYREMKERLRKKAEPDQQIYR